MTQENLDNQRAIVIEELQRSYDNRPYGTAVKALITVPIFLRTLPAPHHRQRLTMSTVAQIEDVIRLSTEAYYVPNNATLVVAGDIEL